MHDLENFLVPDQRLVVIVIPAGKKNAYGFGRAFLRFTKCLDATHVAPAAGEPGVIFSPLDLSVSAGGHYGHALRGYDRLSAQKILRNVLLFRFSQIESRE